MWLKTCLGIMLVLAMSLQGCGRKGPLKMPVAAVHNQLQGAAATVITQRDYS